MKHKKYSHPKNHFTVDVLFPNELAVYKTIRGLSKKPATIVSIPLRKLARKAKLGYDSTRIAITSLSSRGAILFFPGKNQWITSCIVVINEIMVTKWCHNSDRLIHKKEKNISRKTKISSKESNVNYNDYINIINNVRSPHGPSSEKSLSNSSKDALAFEIANTLNDEKNLALYIAYCRRYPAEIINQAYEIAKQTPIEKIKRSRGAFFTYLVKIYAKNQSNTNPGN